MSEPVITVEHLSKRFRLFHERNQSLKAAVLSGRRARYEEFWALDDVTFDVYPGESFGVIGSNGSGKSTLLKCLTNILSPDKGSLHVRGRISALLELGAGFHPELSGRENVHLNGAILGMSSKQTNARFDSIVEFSGLERFIDSPLKTYSSGMYAKLGFSVAIHADPEILIVDEVLSVGDEAFRRKSAERIDAMRAAGTTIVFVSHGLPDMRRLCDRVMWLERGKSLAIGPADEVLDKYLQASIEGTTATAQSARSGTGEIRFTAVELCDENGRPAFTISQHQPVEFRLSWEATRPIQQPSVSLSVTGASGVEVAGVTSTPADELPDLWHGSGVISLRFPALPFASGDYDISVALHPADAGTYYDHWYRMSTFSVEGESGAHRRGVVAVEPTWTNQQLGIGGT